MPTTVLLVGNFISGHHNRTQQTCEALADQLQTTGWQVFRTSTRLNRISRLLDMLVTVWRKRKLYEGVYVEVFSGPSFIWTEVVTWLLQRLNKPYVLTLHGGNLPSFAKRWPGRVRRTLVAANVVTTPSKYLANELGTIRPDIKYLPNGLDLSAYQFIQRKEVSPKLAWLRAFHSLYSPTKAAEVLALLVNEFPKLELTMYGPDKGDGSLQGMRSWAQQAQVSDRIQTPGAIPKTKVPHALAQHDIFLNTTTAESFGVSVMEAAALGMCIVTTNVGELPYLWTHEHDALLVPPNDPQAMADAVRRILTEPKLAEHLSRNARAKAEQFDWSVILPQWEALLSSVAEQGRV